MKSLLTLSAVVLFGAFAANAAEELEPVRRFVELGGRAIQDRDGKSQGIRNETAPLDPLWRGEGSTQLHVNRFVGGKGRQGGVTTTAS